MDLSGCVSLTVVGRAGVNPSVLGVNVGDGQTVVRTDTGPGPELSTSMCMEGLCHKELLKSMDHGPILGEKRRSPLVLN